MIDNIEQALTTPNTEPVGESPGRNRRDILAACMLGSVAFVICLHVSSMLYRYVSPG